VPPAPPVLGPVASPLGRRAWRKSTVLLVSTKPIVRTAIWLHNLAPQSYLGNRRMQKLAFHPEDIFFGSLLRFITTSMMIWCLLTPTCIKTMQLNHQGRTKGSRASRDRRLLRLLGRRLAHHGRIHLGVQGRVRLEQRGRRRAWRGRRSALRCRALAASAVLRLLCLLRLLRLQPRRRSAGARHLRAAVAELLRMLELRRCRRAVLSERH